MLVSLNVKNFAIIDNIDIEFASGMTVLTGETGAGKSLIIDAISLLLGKRAQSDLIRYGENKASITGVFSDINDNLADVLDELAIDYDKNDNLIIKREIYANGKSICKVNTDIISLNDLNKIGDLIGDIHCQEDTFGLINPKNYLSFIINDKIKDLSNQYIIKLKEYKDVLSEYNRKVKENDDIKEKADFLKYQYNELKLAKLSSTEEDELKEREHYLSNYNNVLENINSYKSIYDEQGALDLIYESLNYLAKLKEYDKKYETLYNNLEEAYYNIEEINNNSLLKSANIDIDESELENIQNRLGLYADLKRKYKKTTSELVEYYEKIKKDLELVENFDDILKDIKIKLDKLYQETYEIALNLRNERIKYASSLQESIIANLVDLDLKNTNFKIEFNQIDENNINFLKDGIDVIDFKVSFNKGELLKPLSKVASGGELSRFMLALKTVIGNNLNMQTKIFDEIDTGVSGKVAFHIAKKIKDISLSSQVLCITHLAQVASIADNHIKISKATKDGRTYTEIDLLDMDGRIKEVASMLSNGNISDASLRLAKELIENK